MESRRNPRKSRENPEGVQGNQKVNQGNENYWDRLLVGDYSSFIV